MKKLLKPQDVLLLGLSGTLDVISWMKDPFGDYANAYQNVYGWVPKRFKKSNYYRLVKRSLETGYIEKIIKNNKTYLRLTSTGQEKTKRDFPFTLLQNKKWDGKWRVVIFDIEEKERKNRDFLRVKLKELGFGMIQKSVWISPYNFAVDFREFIKSFGLADQVFVIEVSQLLAGNIKNLVDKIWSLEKLNDEYKKIFYTATKLHDRMKQLKAERKEEKRKNSEIDNINNDNAQSEIKKIRQEYFEVLQKDPCLPKELLPEDWYGEKVKKLLKF